MAKKKYDNGLDSLYPISGQMLPTPNHILNSPYYSLKCQKCPSQNILIFNDIYEILKNGIVFVVGNICPISVINYRNGLL